MLVSQCRIVAKQSQIAMARHRILIHIRSFQRNIAITIPTKALLAMKTCVDNSGIYFI